MLLHHHCGNDDDGDDVDDVDDQRKDSGMFSDAKVLPILCYATCARNPETMHIACVYTHEENCWRGSFVRSLFSCVCLTHIHPCATHIYSYQYILWYRILQNIFIYIYVAMAIVKHIRVRKYVIIMKCGKFSADILVVVVDVTSTSFSHCVAF